MEVISLYRLEDLQQSSEKMLHEEARWNIERSTTSPNYTGRWSNIRSSAAALLFSLNSYIRALLAFVMHDNMHTTIMLSNLIIAKYRHQLNRFLMINITSPRIHQHSHLIIIYPSSVKLQSPIVTSISLRKLKLKT